MKYFPFLYHFQQRFVRAQLQHDVNVLVVFEVIQELADRWVFDAPVDLQLVHKLFLVSSIVEDLSTYYFDSYFKFSLCVLTTVTRSESALAQLAHSHEVNRLSWLSLRIFKYCNDDVFRHKRIKF